MKIEEIYRLFALLEKYSINYNEYVLAKMIVWAQTKQNEEIVNDYFSMRMCTRGSTIELLEGLKESKVINKSYEVPQKGSKLDLGLIPINKKIAKELLQEESVGIA